VKFGKNASDTCAILSKAYGAEAMKKSSVSEWNKWFKESLHVEITKENCSSLWYQGYYSL
jgi:hypothetical protein